MVTWQPDPTFYPSPRMAMKAPPEKLAYVAAFDPAREQPDALAVVDVDPSSSSYSKIVGQVDMPNVGDELHHFGWSACSSCLCPNAPHPHAERRYLVVPGLRSSRLHILDTKANPTKPEIIKVIEPEEILEKTGKGSCRLKKLSPFASSVPFMKGSGGGVVSELRMSDRFGSIPKKTPLTVGLRVTTVMN